MANTATEGYVEHAGHRTWYRMIGDPATTPHMPLVVVHGGPGSTHHSVKVHAGLAEDGFCVLLYDQLGCGRSDRPDDPDLWTFDLFLSELATLVDTLELPHFHLLGHSWGGMLAMRYAVDHPDRVAGLVLAGAPASVPRIARETREMVARLPEEAREAIARHEAAGTVDDPEYRAAVRLFDRRHICRADPWPQDMEEAERERGEQVYAVICGPSEFSIVGRARDWDFTDQLHRITQPTLITSGRHDEFTPGHARDMQRRIPGAGWVCFENSAHMAHLEEPEAYRAVLRDFLLDVAAERR